MTYVYYELLMRFHDIKDKDERDKAVPSVYCLECIYEIFSDVIVELKRVQDALLKDMTME